MDNFDLKKYLSEGRLYEQEYPELISFLYCKSKEF